MCYFDRCVFKWVCQGRVTLDSWLSLNLIHSEHYQWVAAGSANDTCGRCIHLRRSQRRPERSRIVGSELHYTWERRGGKRRREGVRLYAGNNTPKHSNKEDQMQRSVHRRSRGVHSGRGLAFRINAARKSNVHLVFIKRNGVLLCLWQSEVMSPKRITLILSIDCVLNKRIKLCKEQHLLLQILFWPHVGVIYSSTLWWLNTVGPGRELPVCAHAPFTNTSVYEKMAQQRRNQMPSLHTVSGTVEWTIKLPHGEKY